MSDSSALVVYSKPDEVRADLQAIRPQVVDVLPSRVDADRFLRVAAKAIIGNPKLMECTRPSLLVALMEAAELGLEPSGLLGSAYLVPYRVKVKVPHPSNPNAVVEKYVMEAKLIPGYRGLIDLARRSGEILKVEARVVRMRDDFDIDYGREQPIHHRPFIANPADPPEDRDPGPYIGAYMRAMLRDDPVPQVEWMTFDEVEAVRRRSKAADQGPWITDWPEMARKTVVRRGSKYLPLTTDFRRALELDEEAERGAEESQEAPPAINRAAQLLLDRARTAQGVSGAAQEPDGSRDTSPEENGSPRPDLAASGDQEAVEGEVREVPEHSSAPLSGVEQMPPPPATAQQECGEVHVDPNGGESFGTCSRSPGHTGGHRNAAGVWPAKRK